jgi:hypothetical protein
MIHLVKSIGMAMLAYAGAATVLWFLGTSGIPDLQIKNRWLICLFVAIAFFLISL